jgi:hypothetical protein
MLLPRGDCQSQAPQNDSAEYVAGRGDSRKSEILKKSLNSKEGQHSYESDPESTVQVSCFELVDDTEEAHQSPDRKKSTKERAE